MSRRSRKSRGFTLAEAMVSLALLVVVMVVALTLLFTMRSFAERVQIAIEPRQTARRAVDYLAHFLQGATDVGIGAQNAIVTYYNRNAADPASRVQATYDNLTGGQAGFGDEGTDIISLILPTGSPAKYPLVPNWQGTPTPPTVTTYDYWVGFRGGCTGGSPDASNMTAFKTLTGENGTTHSNAFLLIQDNQGLWQYFRIKEYVDNNAGDPTEGCGVLSGRNVHIRTQPGAPGPSAGGDGPLYDPPGGHPATMNDPVFLVTGLEAISFRVRTVNGVPTLQQKSGLFDPATDSPGTDFVPIIENIEDLQIAWFYADGTFWQTATSSLKALSAVTYPNDVPWQVCPTCTPVPARDVRLVLGLRFSVVARSRTITFGARQMSTASLRFRPAAENRAASTTPDDFEHYRATVTIMLKNRMLGS